MALDNGVADGQPDAHAASLGSVERVEEPCGVLRFDTDSGVLHTQHTAASMRLGSDRQGPRPIIDAGLRTLGDRLS